MGVIKKMGSDFLNGTRGNSFKLKEERLKLEVRRKWDTQVRIKSSLWCFKQSSRNPLLAAQITKFQTFGFNRWANCAFGHPGCGPHPQSHIFRHGEIYSCHCLLISALLKFTISLSSCQPVTFSSYLYYVTSLVTISALKHPAILLHLLQLLVSSCTFLPRDSFLAFIFSCS